MASRLHSPKPQSINVKHNFENRRLGYHDRPGRRPFHFHPTAAGDNHLKPLLYQARSLHVVVVKRESNGGFKEPSRRHTNGRGGDSLRLTTGIAPSTHARALLKPVSSPVHSQCVAEARDADTLPPYATSLQQTSIDTPAQAGQPAKKQTT